VDHHQQQQAQRIYNNMAFAPYHLFMDIHTPFFTPFRSLHTLAVDDASNGKLGGKNIFTS
jgi:hypothetical protein